MSKISNITIKKQTILRRKALATKVYSLKIDIKSVKANSKYFKQLFLEAKWLYNYILSQEDIFKINTTNIKSVQVKLFNGTFEERKLTHLSSQMKQSLYDKLKDNIKALSRSKKKGIHIGKLKFRKEINSIILKQFKITYRIKDNKIFIQGLKNPLKIYGLKQLNNAKEIGYAILVKKASGLYLNVACYEDKKQNSCNESLGLDFNCSNTLVLSNGQQIDKIQIKETKRLKKLQQAKSKKVKKSKNSLKINNLIAREHENMTNKKNDLANKIVNKLKNYNIAIQDDNFNGWKSNSYGKTVQHSILGRIKTQLASLETSKVIGQYERTTNTCNCCGEKLFLEKKDRTFKCTNCGHIDFRDVNAAKNILKIGLVQSEFKPLEFELDFSSVKGIKVKTLMLKEEDSNIYVE
ncbi:MAG: transposase [Clostridia bacterium]